MHINAKIPRDDGSLVESLKHQGFEARLARSGIIVRIPQSGEIPSEAKDSPLVIECTEHGGGKTNTGEATVVCGLSGKALEPFFVPKKGKLANVIHAYFSVKSCVVSVHADRVSQVVTITRHEIVRKGDNATIEDEVLWKGVITQLPEIYTKYSNAAWAAMQKAQTYHCRTVFYADIPELSSTQKARFFQILGSIRLVEAVLGTFVDKSGITGIVMGKVAHILEYPPMMANRIEYILKFISHDAHSMSLPEADNMMGCGKETRACEIPEEYEGFREPLAKAYEWLAAIVKAIEADEDITESIDPSGWLSEFK